MNDGFRYSDLLTVKRAINRALILGRRVPRKKGGTYDRSPVGKYKKKETRR